MVSSQRPPLNQLIHIDDFRRFYWLKEELQAFCRAHGIPTSGGKIALTQRIESFLLTGVIETPQRDQRRKVASSDAPLSLDTVIDEGFVCTQRHRAFFKAVIGPKFHFSTFIQQYFKTNIGKTYRDAVDAWYEEAERQKNPAYKTAIAPQFEYNRFIRDFFADPNNHGKTRQEAIQAWKHTRNQPGDNVYVPEE